MRGKLQWDHFSHKSAPQTSSARKGQVSIAMIQSLCKMHYHKEKLWGGGAKQTIWERRDAKKLQGFCSKPEKRVEGNWKTTLWNPIFENQPQHPRCCRSLYSSDCLNDPKSVNKRHKMWQAFGHWSINKEISCVKWRLWLILKACSKRTSITSS